MERDPLAVDLYMQGGRIMEETYEEHEDVPCERDIDVILDLERELFAVDDRECAVVCLWARGNLFEEIAEMLGLEDGDVRALWRSAIEKIRRGMDGA